MQDDGLRVARIISVAAATAIALSCGTNYAYSAWAPQFAERLHLTATQSNIIGNAGNLGMYATGIPIGLVVDGRGPRLAVLIGSICLAAGYFPLYIAYDRGPGQTNFVLLCLASLFTGIGSCSAFSGAIKVCATNWPHHRGTATAIPLSAFGLSAFAYTTIKQLAFPGDAGHLLLFLSIGTFTTVFAGMLFLRLLPPGTSYTSVPSDERAATARRDSNLLSRTDSRQSKHFKDTASEEGESDSAKVLDSVRHVTATDLESAATSETSSLLSGPGDIDHGGKDTTDRESSSRSSGVTGFALLRNHTFWKLFFMLSVLCGVGLCSINNIGNDVKTLWHHWDPKASHDFILDQQLMHVGVLSVCSFLGRLASGIGSDIMVKSYHSSRFWSLVASACVFTVAQIMALNIENPNWLYLLSSFTGLGYGALFGVYPALVADAFGAATLGISWGAITMAPVVSGNIFNLIYGANLDAHSDHPEGSERVCLDGKACYAEAYVVTLIASTVGIGWSLWCVRLDRIERSAKRKELEGHQG
ncbi:major facilitator superfamily domain-containing protein [Elsinoe ampelina]|uniref:Major facilitator superfamily domain-containing protein n=1 Tax=Elsinoe ampelina TaxID=302913 RepID=A0A6A6FXW6_9PEZI|nr:major facilitator superfamily domain-containing protein [Elsinoe ampelina]